MLSGKTDITRGPVLSSIILYSIPIILGSVIQSLFNMADSVVLGQMAGTNAVASVGACTATCSLIVNLFCGLSGGVNVVLARYAGMGDKKLTKDTVNTAILSSAGLGLLALCVSVPLAKWFLLITKCPESCYAGANVYLTIYLLSMPAMLVYNFGATVIRVSGDSQRPLFYLIAAGVLNVILNIVLCLILEQKVAAVAIATFSTQVLGAVLVTLRLLKIEEEFRLDFRRLTFDFRTFVKIIRYGLPCALNGCMFSLSNMQIQTAINSFGAAAVAGNSASQGIEGFGGSFTQGFGTTCLTFLGQNLGARNKERVDRVILCSGAVSVSVCFVVSMVIYVSKRALLGLYVPGDEAAINYGCVRMNYIIRFYIIPAANGILSAMIQAFGYPGFVFGISIGTVLVFRVIWMAAVYPRYLSFDNLMLCFLVSWLLTLVCQAVMALVLYLRYRSGHEKNL